MESEILNELITQLADDYNPGMDAVLLTYVKKAMRIFRNYVNYPKQFTEDQIARDMEKNIDCIGDIAMYRASKQGLEFVKSFSESGTSRSWQDETEIYAMHGIVPYATVV